MPKNMAWTMLTICQYDAIIYAMKNNKPQMEPVYKIAGDNIRKYRNKKGLTQEDLGAIVGIAPNAIASYELARRKIPLYVLLRISKKLAVTVSDLLKKG